MNSAILYAAKSTADTHGSIPTQIKDGKALAKREGLQVVGEYVDEAMSGWSGDRGPGLADALAHAASLGCSLIVQHTDRLARGDGVKARHLGELHFWAIKNDVTIRSCQDDDTFTNPLLAFVMGERNSQDSERKSAAVRAGMKRIAEKGKPHGGQRPYGYEFGEGLLVVIEAEAVIVRRIFREYKAGRALTQIARGLQGDGVPTMRGGRWSPATVSGILKNPIYIGKQRSRPLDEDGAESVHDAPHERIVDGDLWDAVSGLLAARPSRGRGRLPKGPHLFRAGLLRCGTCGSAMTPRSHHDSRDSYYCTGRASQGAEFCPAPMLPQPEVDAAVFAYFRQVALDRDATRDSIATTRDAKLAEITELRTGADREARKAEANLARVEGDYKTGEITAAEWRKLSAGMEEDVTGAQAEADRLAAQQAEVETWGALVDAESEVESMISGIRSTVTGEVREAADVDAVRAALRRLFSGFTVQAEAGRVHADLIGRGFVIVPEVREQVIEGYTENLTPVIRAEALAPAENKQALAFPRACLFDPIVVQAS